MQTFNFYSDRLVTGWERTEFSIDAESKEEAFKMLEDLKKKEVIYLQDMEEIFPQGNVYPSLMMDTFQYVEPNDKNDVVYEVIYVDKDMEEETLFTNCNID